MGNFHPDYSSATDYKTRYALKETSLWGAYITDIIKDFEEKASENLMRYLRENPEFEKQNINTFLDELKFIGAVKPTLVAFGNDSYNILKRNLGERFSILKIPHYAYRNFNKKNYREKVLKELSKHQ